MTREQPYAHDPDAPSEVEEQWTGFLSGFVHELKTPLASLSMIAEMLAREDGFRAGERAARYTVNLRELVREMQVLIDDTGALVRLASGGRRIAREPVSVPELVRRVAEAARGRGWEHGISLSTDVEWDCPATIRTDVSVLEEALARLLETGSLFAEKRLTLHVAASDEALVFTAVPDHVHAPEQDLEGLFEPFSGGMSRSLRQRGARPLAPALARELARVLDGEVEAVAEGERTICVLRVPLDAADTAR